MNLLKYLIVDWYIKIIVLSSKIDILGNSILLSKVLIHKLTNLLSKNENYKNYIRRLSPKIYPKSNKIAQNINVWQI